MAKGFKPIRFFVMFALLAFITCGIVGFCTHRAAHGHTPEERAAFDEGVKFGVQAAPGSELPSMAGMNEMAEKILSMETRKDDPMAWKTAFENGYQAGYARNHSVK